jgi:hypothetical protein
MTDASRTCDAEGCERRATQVGTAELPIRPIELRLCDTHVAALQARKLRGISQDRTWRGGYGRPQVSFDDE